MHFDFLHIYHALAACDPNQGYCSLEALPGITNSGGNAPISDFFPGVVKLAIMIAGALAVIRIIIGGLQYISTDAWGKKSDAKGTITNALMGLLLAIGAFSILYTLNPNILSLNLSLTRPPTSGPIDTTIGGTQSADDLGCHDCVPVDPEKIPIKEGACSNTPCYAKSVIETNLESVTEAMAGKVGWEVTQAFPSNSLHLCLEKNDPTAGTCVVIAPLLSTDSALGKFLSTLYETVGSSFTYIVPNSSTASSRVDHILSLMDSVPVGVRSQLVVVDFLTDSEGAMLNVVSGKGSGCTSDCDYNTPAINGGWGHCPNCVALAPGIPLKSPYNSPYPPEVQELLHNELAGLLTSQGTTNWWVTEAWPPEYKSHDSSCHKPGSSQSGNCVDAALRKGTGPSDSITVTDIKNFILNIKAVTGSADAFQYEVACTAGMDTTICQNQVNAIKAAVGSDYHICLNSNATGDHVHINGPGIVGTGAGCE